MDKNLDLTINSGMVDPVKYGTVGIEQFQSGREVKAQPKASSNYDISKPGNSISIKVRKAQL